MIVTGKQGQVVRALAARALAHNGDLTLDELLEVKNTKTGQGFS